MTIPLLLALLLATVQTSPAPTPAKPAPKPTPAPPVLQGVVKGPDGKPIEKALVLVRPIASRFGDPFLTARTDATGAFRVPLKNAGLNLVRVEAPGLAAQTLEKVQPGATLTVTLLKGGLIEGVVKDGASGQPVRRARVTASADGPGMAATWEAGAGVVETVTDAKGAFRLEGLASGAHTVAAGGRGYGRAQQRSVPLGRRVELFLFPGATITGVVRGPASEPLAGVAVRAEAGAGGGMRFGLGGSGSAPRLTDAQGRFDLLGLEPGVYRVLAFHKDWAPGLAGGLVLDRQGDVEVELRLEKGVPVKGRLVDANARPQVGRVAAQDVAGESGVRSLAEVLRAEAGADGRFTVERMPPGSHGLTVEARGFSPKRVDADVRAGDAVVDLGDIVLEMGGTIQGRVRDQAGQPVSGASVMAQPPRTSAMMAMPVEAICEADGSFIVAGLQPGAYQLSARAAGYGSSPAKPATVGDAAVVLVLEPAGSITGIAVDEAGRPLDAFFVGATPTRREPGMVIRGGARNVSSSDGRFTVEDLSAGEFVLQITAPERSPGIVSDVRVAAGAVTDVGRVKVAAGGVVRGTVVDPNGAAVPGATVTVMGAAERFSGPMQPSASTDGGGAFEVRGVPPGMATAQATHPSFAAGVASGLEVDPAKGPTDTRIVVTPGGRIEGFARKRGNLPLPGTFVMASPASRGPFAGAGGAQSATGPDGSFVLDHVPAGRTMVTLMTRGAGSTYTNMQSREADVQEGQTTTVEFFSREIFVSGRVTRGGSPVPGVRLVVRGNMMTMMSFGGPGAGPAAPPTGPQRMTAVSREDGGYEMLVDEPGKLSVHFDMSDGSSFPARQLEVPDAESFTADFEFAGLLLSGTVVDRETERPLGGAWVSAAPKQGAQGMPATMTTLPDGRFQLSVEAGEHRVQARAEGYLASNEEVSVGASGAEVRLALTRGQGLRGKVVDARSRPLGGLDVSASSSTGGHTTGGGHAFTLPDGSFEFSGLEARPHTLVAGTAEAGFAVRPGVSPGEAGVVLRLRPGGRLRITVLGTDGLPVAGALPRVTKIDGQPILWFGMGLVPTDVSGATELATPAGALEIEASKGRLHAMAAISVGEGGTGALELRLAERPPAKSP
jgi:hypothetical protein